MKKLLFLTLAIAATASSAFAAAGSSGTSTSQFIWTPTTQSPVSSNSTFQVTLSIQGGVQGTAGLGVDGFDLWLGTAAANSGLFTIQSVTYSRFTNFGNITGGTDSLNQTSDISSGYVRNTSDLGNIDSSTSAANAIANGNTFQVATFTIQTGVLAPNTTYTFFTTLGSNTPLAGIATSNGHYSDVVVQGGAVYEVAQSSFSITSAVPEPGTLSLLGLGGLGSLGMTILRARRKS
jgi:PEP-CTERM motif